MIWVRMCTSDNYYMSWQWLRDFFVCKFQMFKSKRVYMAKPHIYTLYKYTDTQTQHTFGVSMNRWMANHEWRMTSLFSQAFLFTLKQMLQTTFKLSSAVWYGFVSIVCACVYGPVPINFIQKSIFNRNFFFFTIQMICLCDAWQWRWSTNFFIMQISILLAVRLFVYLLF